MTLQLFVTRILLLRLGWQWPRWRPADRYGASRFTEQSALATSAKQGKAARQHASPASNRRLDNWHVGNDALNFALIVQFVSFTEIQHTQPKRTKTVKSIRLV
jgi:hypothetical protein